MNHKCYDGKWKGLNELSGKNVIFKWIEFSRENSKHGSMQCLDLWHFLVGIIFFKRLIVMFHASH